MNCCILRDILPLYCDNLTSKESNMEIIKHLRDCENCNTLYENMNKNQDVIKIIEKDINPLKKVNKRNKYKVGVSSLITFAITSLFFMFVLKNKKKKVYKNEKNN